MPRCDLGVAAVALTTRPFATKLGVEMKKLYPSSAAKILAMSGAAGVALIATLPAFAAQTSLTGFVTQQQSASHRDVVPTVIWVIVAVLIACVVGGIFYLFKRQVGAFPKNPTWKAPISIMLSRDLPGDDEPHEAHADSTHDVTAHGPAPHTPAH